MTNGEKLAKEMLENLDDFAKILLFGIYYLRTCDDCPIHNVRICNDQKCIKNWLESEVEEDAEIH